jgi:hypothetical protein
MPEASVRISLFALLHLTECWCILALMMSPAG